MGDVIAVEHRAKDEGLFPIESVTAARVWGGGREIFSSSRGNQSKPARQPHARRHVSFAPATRLVIVVR